MFTSLHNEIPEFLREEVICVTNSVLCIKNKSTLLLTKQLQLYEFKNKVLLNQIDLNATCLGKGYEKMKLENTIFDSKFGKYVHKYNHYILLQCWQELVVLQHSSEAGFTIIGEWSRVKSFQLIHGALKYQPIVQIHLDNDEIITTDFQLESSDEISDIDLRKQFESDLKHVRQLKTELQIQKEFTKRDLQRFRNEQYFGNHLVRSVEVEELQPLTRYGGIWIRLTPSDKLVIGVPLVNNCSAPNISTLKNIQAVFFNGKSALEKFQYKCVLYTLKQRFEDLETIESFFKTDESDKFDPSSWGCSKTCELPPGGFGVMVLIFEVAHLVLIQTGCPLLITYEIEKDLQLFPNKPHKLKVFKQQLFVKNISFSEIISLRTKLCIKFEDKTLHQDLLAICSSNFKLKLHITFQNNYDAAYFESLLRKAFDCEIVRRRAAFNHSDLNMDFDEEDTEINNFPHMIFYNNKTNSYWYGLLVVCEKSEANEYEYSSLWKFYVVNEARGLVLLRLILDDFLRERINVKEITLKSATDLTNKCISESTLINALNLELSCIIEVLSNVNLTLEAYVKKMATLTELQITTDLAISATFKNVKLF